MGTFTWHSDGTFLTVRYRGHSMFQQEEAFHRSSDDGSKFLSPRPARLVGLWDIPAWWKYRFTPDAALPGDFNADRLVGCKVAFHWRGICYSARLGQEIWSATTNHGCSFPKFYRARGGTRFKYSSSAYGVQSYISNETCEPTAAYKELLLEVADVNTGGMT